MSMLLSDRVWVMLSEVSKRGVYPTHGSMVGIFRLPVDIVGQNEINNVINELKSTGFTIDAFADRIFVKHKWTEKGFDIYTNKDQTAELSITVDIVTGEVIDLIYQIKPLELFGDYYWIKDYRNKTDRFAKTIIDTVIRNTRIGQKLVAHYQKTQKLSREDAAKKLEEMTPLANAHKSAKDLENKSLTSMGPSSVPKSPLSETVSVKPAVAVPSASPPAVAATTPSPTPSLSSDTTIQLTGTGTGHSAAEGPIDMGFKSKRQTIGKFKGIQVWGPYDPPGQLGIWGTDVCVDFDICVSDGACLEACPVNVYEWLDTPGHPASERKPFMIREKDCIFCLACENVCPPQAIKIFKK
ncbi:MAG: 4Fe-4S binding protein [Thermoproteota archaeon]|nr:4Fe-4S binding protein [Thermoproteota archaeon]